VAVPETSDRLNEGAVLVAAVAHTAALDGAATCSSMLFCRLTCLDLYPSGAILRVM
jgi:hypothetical protein